MKILLLTDGIHPYVIGGMQKHSYNLAYSLALAGIKVHIVHCVYEGEIPEIDERSFNKKVIANLEFSCYKFPSLGRLPGHYMRENKAYSQAIFKDFGDKWQAYDFIYAKGFTAWELFSHKKNISVPIGVNFHGYEMYQQAPSWKVKLSHYLLRKPVKYNTLNADYVFSYGGKITRIIQDLGVRKEKIIEIPTGIASDWLNEGLDFEANFPVADIPRKFLFIGRYERRKGIEELHTAIQQIREEQLPTHEFHFIGPISKSHQLNLDKVFYHGEIKDSKMIKSIMRGCDVLICPSHSEGMPNVILEGMASGLAIIATDVGAIAQQIGGNGWLLPKPSVELLKEAIKAALFLPQYQLNEMKEISLHLIQSKFLWSKIVTETIEKITQAIEAYKLRT